ncbi:SPARC-like [Anneissia japonica]|uniref:SPARC-like n=1 Tax=Anneissia japonica TaxID=1529436 RepID=UPI001425A858|nr:SPARC-like [Anneissia japonica]
MASYNMVLLIIAFIATASAAILNQRELSPENNPCYGYKCKSPVGSMCEVVEKGKKLKPSCVCPDECPSEVAPVCSVYGKQYDNLCLLHKTACQKKRAIPLAFFGECVAKTTPCTQSELEDFPHRLLEWFLHLREVDEFGQINPNNHVRNIPVQQRIELAEWKFELLNRKDGDDKLDRRDLREFRYALMPLEHCADNFFKMCDKGDDVITLDEWIECLGVDDFDTVSTSTLPKVDGGEKPDFPEGEPDDEI